MSELFDDAEPYEETLEDHSDSADEAESHENVDVEAKASQQRQWREENPYPAIWLMDSVGSRMLIDLALDELTQDDPDLYPKTELAKKAGVSRQSVYDNLDRLVEVGIWIEEGSNRPMYRVNEDSDALKSLILENDVIMDQLGGGADEQSNE